MTFHGTKIGSFHSINLEPPYSPQRYLEAIQLAEDGGIEYLVIDSLSHAWAGEGGMLDLQGAIAKRTGNGYTAWRDITPQHNRLVDKLLQCGMHVAVAMRSKTEYVIEDNDKGKKTPRKVGTAPVFREGIEYEFTTFFDLSLDHVAAATKDRTGLFDGQYFTITPGTGEIIHGWLCEAGPLPDIPREPKSEQLTTNDGILLSEKVDHLMMRVCQDMNPDEKRRIAEEIKQITGGIANYRSISDEAVLQQIYDRFMEVGR